MPIPIAGAGIGRPPSGDEQPEPSARQCDPLLERIERGEIDPTRVITHRLPLAEAPHGSDIFKNKQERLREGGAQALTARAVPGRRGGRDEHRRARRPTRRGSRRACGRLPAAGPPDGLQVQPQVRGRAAGPRSRRRPRWSATPRIAGGDAGARRDRAQHRLGAVEQVRFDDHLPRAGAPGKKWSTVRSQMPANGSRGNMTTDLAGEGGDRHPRRIGCPVAQRDDHAEEHRAEDDAVEVAVAAVCRLQTTAASARA